VALYCTNFFLFDFCSIDLQMMGALLGAYYNLCLHRNAHLPAQQNIFFKWVMQVRAPVRALQDPKEQLPDQLTCYAVKKGATSGGLEFQGRSAAALVISKAVVYASCSVIRWLRFNIRFRQKKSAPLQPQLTQRNSQGGLNLRYQPTDGPVAIRLAGLS
jgi:hypothetical protein